LSGEYKVVYRFGAFQFKMCLRLKEQVENISLTDGVLVPQADAFRYSLVFSK